MNTAPDRPQTDPAATTERVLAVCKHRWETRGVAPADIDDMLDELRTHLVDAAAHGRTAAEVVGSDVDDFARGWARARAPRRSRWLRVAGQVFFVVVMLTLLQHLISRTTAMAITPGRVLYLVGLLTIMLSWRPRNEVLSFRRLFLASAIIAVPAIVLDEVLLPDVVLVQLPLWVTGSLAALAIAGTWWDTRRNAARRRRQLA